MSGIWSWILRENLWEKYSSGMREVKESKWLKNQHVSTGWLIGTMAYSSSSLPIIVRFFHNSPLFLLCQNGSWIIQLFFSFANMSLDLEYWDDDEEDWCIPPVKTLRSRTLSEIHSLQVKLILHNTELDPETWVRIYAEKFRAIMDEDPSLTEFQVKHRLYFSTRLWNQTNTSPKRSMKEDLLKAP